LVDKISASQFLGNNFFILLTDIDFYYRRQDAK